MPPNNTLNGKTAESEHRFLCFFVCVYVMRIVIENKFGGITQDGWVGGCGC